MASTTKKQRSPFLGIILPLHRWLYRTTGGRIGGKLAGIPMLLLYTVGRKSGKNYVMPLAYHPHTTDDGTAYVVVASNSGFDRHPGWYFNVLADENAQAQVMGETFNVSVRELTGDEYDSVWVQAIQTNRAWAGYKEKTTRKIPLILLIPQSTI